MEHAITPFTFRMNNDEEESVIIDTTTEDEDIEVATMQIEKRPFLSK